MIAEQGPSLFLSGHQRFQLRNQARNVMTHSCPDSLQIDIEVSVHETVSHPDYFVPRDFGM